VCLKEVHELVLNKVIVIFRILSLISGGFLDDIALPNVGLELEWERQKQNKSYLEEVEKYKKEILMEGLQVKA
jgi:hypothetical protein